MIVRPHELSPIDFGGLKILDFTGGAEQSSSLALVTAPAGSAHPVAWSKRSDKYYYVLSGSLRFTLDAETVMLDAGDFCLVRRGRHFSYENVGAVAAQLVLVHTPSFDLAAEVFASG